MTFSTILKHLLGLIVSQRGAVWKNHLSELNSNCNYVHLCHCDIPADGTVVEVPYPIDIKGFIYVSYGSKNHYQAYGGGTVMIHRNETKPCFLPVYIPSKNTIEGYVYIYNNVPAKKLVLYSGQTGADFLASVYVTK